MLTRREALTAAAAGAVALVADGPVAWGHGRHRGHAIPGVRGMDHVGITVPDIAEARAWFEDVIGCYTPLRFGPFSDPTGTFMQDLLEVHPRAVIPEINVLRCGTGSNIELFEYTSPDQDTRLARNSDFSGHHLAFYVEDIDVAVAYMEAKGVRKFFGPFPVTDGPAAGQTINYFQAPFGTYVELISYPDGMAYEQTARHKLWSAYDIGAKPIDKGIPGLLGLDHVGLTVPDIRLARKWLRKNLGAVAPLRFGPLSDPTGTFMTDLVDVHPRAVIDEINVVRIAKRLQHRAVPVLLARSGHPPRRELELLGPPHRDLRRRHRQGGREPREAARGAQAPRPPARDRGTGRRAIDQLLRHAARALRRAHLVPRRDGIRGDRRGEALEPQGRAQAPWAPLVDPMRAL